MNLPPLLSFLSHPVLLEKYPVEVVGGSIGNPLHLHGVWEVTFRSQEWHRDMLIPIQLYYGFIYSSYKTNHYFKPLHYDRKIPSLEISEYQQTNLFQFFCKQNAIVKIVLHEKKIPIFRFKSSILFSGAMSPYRFCNQDLHILSYSAFLGYYYAIIYESTALSGRQRWT